MAKFHWALDAGHATQNAFVNCWSAVLESIMDSWTWLLEPRHRDRRIYSIIKCAAYVLVGAALTLYIGWKGIELAQAGLRISKQSNRLSAKQICDGGNLTSEDQNWCDDPRNNLPLSSIMESIAANTIAVHNWLYSRLAALGLCGAHSLGQRGGETCLGLGIALLLYLFIPTKAVTTIIKPGRLTNVGVILVSYAYQLDSMVICVPLASIVLEHLRAQERINFAVKVVGLALGTAFVRFFGWRSMNSEAAVQATSQGNRLSAKQVCSSMVRRILVSAFDVYGGVNYTQNLMAGDRLRCEEFNHNVPYCHIVNASKWTVISAASKTTWFNTVFTTASLCGTYSLAERRADTCFGLTIVQVVYFLAESAPCGEQLKRMLLRQYVPSRLAHLADVKLGTYFNAAVVLMLVSLVIMAVALVVTDIMRRSRPQNLMSQVKVQLKPLKCLCLA